MYHILYHKGTRSSENTSDVKADQGPPSVENASEATPGQDEQDKQQLNIGTQQSATGEDASVEDDYKPGKDEPGTSHPANANIGEKYASMSFSDLHNASAEMANAILADLAVGAGGASLAQPAVKQAAAPPQQPANPAAAEAMSAGYELATQLGLDKQAAEEGVQSMLAETVKEASQDAEMVAGYLYKVADVQKTAALPPDPEGGESHTNPSDASSGANEAGSGGGASEEAPVSPDGAGGGPVPGLPPGIPPMGGEMGGEMGGGGEDLGGLGGIPGGEPSEEEAIMELIAALEELGIPPEMLLEAVGGGGGGEMGGAPGGEMGGAPPMGGGEPPMPPGPEGPMGGPGAEAGTPPIEITAVDKQQVRTDLKKIAEAAKDFQRSGKYEKASSICHNRISKLH